MKSILFVLLMRLQGEVTPLAVFETIEQCHTDMTMHSTNNLAAAYSCQPAEVRGTLLTPRKH